MTEQTWSTGIAYVNFWNGWHVPPKTKCYPFLLILWVIEIIIFSCVDKTLNRIHFLLSTLSKEWSNKNIFHLPCLFQWSSQGVIQVPLRHFLFIKDIFWIWQIWKGIRRLCNAVYSWPLSCSLSLHHIISYWRFLRYILCLSTHSFAQDKGLAVPCHCFKIHYIYLRF